MPRASDREGVDNNVWLTCPDVVRCTEVNKTGGVRAQCWGNKKEKAVDVSG
jgi:hypothetical protein